MVVEMDHPILGNIKSLGMPTKFSKTPLSIRFPAPWLGQHTEEKLREIGFSEKEINQLFEKEIIFNKYPSQS